MRSLGRRGTEAQGGRYRASTLDTQSGCLACKIRPVDSRSLAQRFKDLQVGVSSGKPVVRKVCPDLACWGTQELHHIVRLNLYATELSMQTKISIPCLQLYVSRSVSQGFYSRWGQLAHLSKLQFFIRKRKRQNSNIDKQNHHQKTVEKLSPCFGSTYISALLTTDSDPLHRKD